MKKSSDMLILGICQILILFGFILLKITTIPEDGAYITVGFIIIPIIISSFLAFEYFSYYKKIEGKK